MHEAKVPDFLKASGQDMLQEATDELLGRYSHRSIARLLTGLDHEGNQASTVRELLHLLDTIVANGDAEHIGC